MKYFAWITSSAGKKNRILWVRLTRDIGVLCILEWSYWMDAGRKEFEMLDHWRIFHTAGSYDSGRIWIMCTEIDCFVRQSLEAIVWWEYARVDRVGGLCNAEVWSECGENLPAALAMICGLHWWKHDLTKDETLVSQVEEKNLIRCFFWPSVHRGRCRE